MKDPQSSSAQWPRPIRGLTRIVLVVARGWLTGSARRQGDVTTMAEIRVHTRAAASVQTTWSVLTDQVGMSAWAPVRSVTLERDGDPDGIGAIRVLSRPPLTLREQITDIQCPHRLSYEFLSGAPVRDYTGETVLTGNHEATDIVWTVRLRQRFPGMTFLVRWTIRRLALGLAAQSERVAHQPAPCSGQRSV